MRSLFLLPASLVVPWTLAACSPTAANPSGQAADAGAQGGDAGLADVSSDLQDTAKPEEAASGDGLGGPDGPLSQDANGAEDAGPDLGPSPADATSGDAVDLPTPITCPIAVVQVLEGPVVLPQTVLHLDGTKSKAAPQHTIAKWQWKIASQPPASSASLQPSATHPKPTVVVNHAGQYELCLEVMDSQGLSSCAPACVTVDVQSQGLHIELAWETPGDLDKTDVGPKAAADLDLHFAHSLAMGQDLDCDKEPDPWFSNPFDCFWYNPSPQWGAKASPADDPKLAEGAPELLDILKPEGTAQAPQEWSPYSVGVHVWNDNGYGPSTAYVNLYVDGGLVGKFVQQVSAGDMWFVTRIHWPGSPAKPLLQPCWQTDVPCQGGKAWQDKGNPCVTPCYYNSAFSALVGAVKPAACP